MTSLESLHIMHPYIVISLIRGKNWLVLRTRPPIRFASLRGEDNCPNMLMVLGLMKNRFNGTYIEKSSLLKLLVTSLSQQSTKNDNQCTFDRYAPRSLAIIGLNEEEV